MKVVIDISEEDYQNLKAKDKLDDIYLNYYEKLIANGIPLPKGHGDLKDVEKLKQAFIKWSMAVQGSFTDSDIASIVSNSPTIIEADK